MHIIIAEKLRIKRLTIVELGHSIKRSFFLGKDACIFLVTLEYLLQLSHSEGLKISGISHYIMAKKQQEPIMAFYLKYHTLGDLLKVILYSSQSPIGALPMLYYINQNNQHIIFLQTGAIGITTIHYHIEQEKPAHNFIELKRLSGDYHFVDKIGSESMSLYLPLLELDKASVEFP